MLSAAAGSNHPERDQALISFFVETGARLSEVVGLKVDDVDLAGGVAVVRGKGNRQRFVFFDASTRKVLMMWLAVGIGFGHCLLLSFWAATRLRRHLRAVAMSRYQPLPPWRWRLLGRRAARRLASAVVALAAIAAACGCS